MRRILLRGDDDRPHLNDPASAEPQATPEPTYRSCSTCGTGPRAAPPSAPSRCAWGGRARRWAVPEGGRCRRWPDGGCRSCWGASRRGRSAHVSSAPRTLSLYCWGRRWCDYFNSGSIIVHLRCNFSFVSMNVSKSKSQSYRGREASKSTFGIKMMCPNHKIICIG